MQTEIVFSNGITLKFDGVSGGQFNGIGQLFYRGRPLRSSLLPWRFYTESEAEGRGVRFESFTLIKVRETQHRLELVLRSRGTPLPRLQAADAMGEARVVPREVTPPQAVFTWVFEPITETIGDESWDGLAMQIRYESPGHPIHWLLEEATWELGGEANANTLIGQDVSAMLGEHRVAPGDAFSTIERFFTEGWGGSYPMDMLPRAAGASICDFQAKGNLALTLFSEAPGLTRARLDKRAEEEVIHYLDRVYFPLCDRVETPVRKLLVHAAPAPLQKHEVRNLWLDCFSEVRRRIHATYGFELEVPEPCTGGHLWDEDLQKWGKGWIDAIKADLPEYARLGYRQANIHGVWESITSDPNPPEAGNICCPYQFRFAETYGGADDIRALNDVAAAHDVRLMQWFAFHLSKHAPVWKEHPEWVLNKASGEPWNGSYSGLWSGRFRSEYGQRFEAEVQAVREETGLTGIFWDSYQNLGITCVDWGAPDKAPQAEEIFRMQSRLQKSGFRQRCEVTTIFGVSAVGIFGFDNDRFRRRLWSDFVEGDHAFTLMDTSPAFFTGGGVKAICANMTPQVYFHLLAHRVVPGLGADPWGRHGDPSLRLPGGERAEEYARVNHLYNQALPRMHRLRLVKGGTHVLWHDADGRPAVLWAFCNEPLPELAGAAQWVTLQGREPATHATAGEVYEALS